MTPGQEQAVRELERLQAASPGDFELDAEPADVEGRLVARISIRIGALETRDGGLELLEREHFLLSIPPGFPFDCPSLSVAHRRFERFPHVIWAHVLCLYQSKLEWNPADGLFGFFGRLSIWLVRAALNDMDPPNGPLEPPHHITDFAHVPIIVRSTPPVEIGADWFGFARLTALSNRMELDGWNNFDDTLNAQHRVAPALFLPTALPMEFPRRGVDFFSELRRHSVSHERLLAMLSVAALLTPEGENAYLVLGAPMRRTPEGKPAHHIAVWAIDAERTRSLRRAVPSGTDTAELLALRQDLAEAIQAVFEASPLRWCRVFEERAEIIAPRDADTPITWFKDRRILLLGCGALGSWTAEMITRSGAAALHLVDDADVKPGLLVRQNFSLDDVGSNKADALANRLGTLRRNLEVQAYGREAHEFLIERRNQLASYDMIVDCTASSLMQMKLERDWSLFATVVQRMCSVVIDADAQRFLLVSVAANSPTGPWSAFVGLKYKVCTENQCSDVRSAFYSEARFARLFQPEPGCSDPTFRGSSADVVHLAAAAVNQMASWAAREKQTQLVACSRPLAVGGGELHVSVAASTTVIPTSRCRVLVSSRTLNEIRATVRQNKRLRSNAHETGGLLWGYWDEACGLIVVFDASGPPPDSQHDRAHFRCGVEGTVEEHKLRSSRSGGTSGFLGFWHTHPGFASRQSAEDILAMSSLVARAGHGQRRALMIILGRDGRQTSAGIFVYESKSLGTDVELVCSSEAQIVLGEDPIL